MNISFSLLLNTFRKKKKKINQKKSEKYFLFQNVNFSYILSSRKFTVNLYKSFSTLFRVIESIVYIKIKASVGVLFCSYNSITASFFILKLPQTYA